MTVQYFGHNQEYTDGDDDLSGYTLAFSIGDSPTTLFTCPGSGSMTLKELGAIIGVPSSSSSIRMAVYDNSGNLVAQTASLAVEGASYSWYTGTTFYDSGLNAISPPNLTGGASYTLCETAPSGTSVKFACTFLGAHNKYVNTSYSTGFPSTLPGGLGNDNNECQCMRCGVEQGGAADTAYFNSSQQVSQPSNFQFPTITSV